MWRGESNILFDNFLIETVLNQLRHTQILERSALLYAPSIFYILSQNYIFTYLKYE